MDRYTYCSEEGCEAVKAALPFKYSIELNRSDMEGLIDALRLAWDNSDEWAGEFLSSIAQTVDVDFV